MDDRCLMEDLLLVEKGVCDLYMHGSIESSTGNVKQAFTDALDESLNMQGTIYNKMSAKGWYSAGQAEQTKVNSVKQKFQSV